MRTNITLAKRLAKSLVLVAGIFAFGFQTQAQAPVQGGVTYIVDGTGNDLTAPKDTFANLMGAYGGGAYTNTTGIFNAITVNGVDQTTIGQITILLVPGYSGVEPTVISIGSASIGAYNFMNVNRPIVVRPSNGNIVTLTTGSVTGTQALLRFNGAGFITFDGESSPGQRNLTFAMPVGATAASVKVIDFNGVGQNGCQNITIKNCVITGNSNTSAINTFAGVYIGGTSATPINPVRRSQNIIIENNLIQSVRHGVYARGISTAANSYDLGLIVRNNIIGGTIAPFGAQPTTFVGGNTANGCAGILLSAQANANIQGNIIRNSLPGIGGFRGIELSTQGGNLSVDSNISINGNKFYNLYTTQGSQGIYAIRSNLGLRSVPSNIRITNNTISRISATAGATTLASLIYPIGILIEDNGDNLGYSILHNSIYMSSDTLTSGGISAAIVTAGSVRGGINFQNNLIGVADGRALSATGNPTFSYGVAILGPQVPFSSNSNNAFYLTNFRGGYVALANIYNRNRFNIREWEDISFATNTRMTIPPFIGNDDSTLSILAGAPSTLGNGGVGAGVLTDINGNTRSGTTPSIGAYEFSPNLATARYPLAGGQIYAINGINNLPSGAGGTGSFATVSDAVTYLNNFGVVGTGTVRLQIEPGYPREDKIIPAVINFAGSSVNRPVELGIAPTYNDTITIPAFINQNNFNTIFRFLGTRFMRINGAGLPGQNNLWFTMPTAANGVSNRVIAITSTDTSSTTDISIQNVTIVGNSNTSNVNTFAGIYHGLLLPPSTTSPNASSVVGRNNNINISNNRIWAVRNGVFVRGQNAAGGQNINWTVNRNVIGGDVAPGGANATTYIGGNITNQAEQSGIMLKSVVLSTIDSNIIRNTIATTNQSNQFAGIRLEAFGEQGPDSAILISKNFIYNLTTVSGQTIHGVRINLSTQDVRFIRLINNSISSIRSTGAGTPNSVNNPAAVSIDAGGVVNNMGVIMYNNTINLSGTSLTNNSSSSCVYIGANVRGGLDFKNNILSNRLGRVNGLGGNAYTIFVVSNVNPFATPNGNSVFNTYNASAPNSNNFIGATNNNGTLYSSLTEWRLFTLAENGSFFFAPRFLNDSLPDLDLAFAGGIFNGAFPVTGATTDIYGTIRPTAATCIGAVQFNQIFSPLMGNGVYLINGVYNPPTLTLPNIGSFATINQAVQYLNANGVDGFFPNQPISLLITSGYLGEGDTLISPLLDYPRMNINRVITLRTDIGRNDTITINPSLLGNNSSLFRFQGGSFFTIDGNNGSGGRNITFLIPPAATNNTIKVIDMSPLNASVSNVTIRNCNIVGASNTSAPFTFAGIYLGGIISTPSNPIAGLNNNNRFENNFIGAVRNGIYLRGFAGTAGQQDRSGQIVRNIIGGDIAPGGPTATNYIGGLTGAAGVFLSSQAGTLVDSNVIRNMVVGAFNNISGIELSTVASTTLSLDSGMTISRNNIYKIVSTSAAAYGIRMNFGSGQFRNTRVINNTISRIQSAGTSSGSAVNVANPFGILVESTANANDLGLDIFYNSINLGPANSLLNTATSAAIMFNSFVRGGVRTRNNIFQNSLGATAGFANAYAVVVGSNLQIFGLSDNNAYFAGATNANNRIAARNAAVTPTFITNMAAMRSFTLMDTQSFNFVTPFLTDTNLIIPNGAATLVYGSAQPLTTVTNDILGNARSFVFPCIGANDFIGTYPDSIAPLVYNYTSTLGCSNGPYTIRLRVIERNVLSDTLYYRINGGAEIPVTSPIVSGFNRTFTIPAQSGNSSIEYRYSVNDGSNFVFNTPFPQTGYTSLSTIFSNFPITYGFDLPNSQGWLVEQISGSGGWDLNSFGSGNLPILGPNTGIRAALFPAASLPVGTGSRLISPCFDLSILKQPTLRLFVSQNSDVPNLNDSINFVISIGGSPWSVPLRTIRRVNNSFAFPGYDQIDICLSDYVGVVGFRFGLEAFSRGGNNIVLDSIVFFDDAPNLLVTPNPSNVCAYDSISLNIAGTSDKYSYRLTNIFDPIDPLSNNVLGNNGTLNIKAWHKLQDSLYIKVVYNNELSLCGNIMDDTIKVYVPKFTGGPFLTAGTPFDGSFGIGSFTDPDGAEPGDILTYNVNPPSGFTNAQYGSRWTIVNVSAQTVSGAVPNSAIFTPPAGSVNARYVITPSVANDDSLYRIRLTIRLLPSGCDSVFERWVKVTSSPTADFLVFGPRSFCALTQKTFGNTSTFNPNTEPITYLWEFGDGNTATTFNGVHTYAAPGNYVVKLTATNKFGIASSDTANITVLVAPTVSYTTSRACAGGPISFTNTTSGTVNSSAWTFRLGNTVLGTDNNNNATFTFPTGDTNYNVTLAVTNGLGCSNTTNTSFYVFPSVDASFTAQSHCSGSLLPVTNNTTIASSKPNNSFGSVWEFGNGDVGLSNQPSYSYPVGGTYVVKLKVETNFGCIDSATASISVFNAPNASFTVSNACQFDALNITNTTTFAGGLSNVAFAWDFGDNSAIVIDQNPSKVYGAAGTYIIKLIASESTNGCFDSAVQAINVNQKPVSAFNVKTQNCLSDPIVFTNVSTPPSQQTLTYAWNFGDANSSTTTSPTHTYSVSGNYNVKLITTTNFGCSDTSERTVSATEVPPVTINKTVVTGNPWDGEITFTATPSNLASYRWSFGDNQSGNGIPYTHQYTRGGTYTVSLTVSDANGCERIATNEVTVNHGVGLNDELASSMKFNISPNPFTDITNLSFDLTNNSDVQIDVYDMTGRKLHTVNNGTMTKGLHTIELDVRDFATASSAYMVRVLINDEVITRTIIRAK
jgi:PKD repeat protein